VVVVKLEAAAASAGGTGFGAWRPDPMALGQGVAPVLVAAHALWLLAALSVATSAGA